MKDNNIGGEIVHLGNWDGMPIWRQRTAREKLLRYLEENEKNSTQKPPESEVEEKLEANWHKDD